MSTGTAAPQQEPRPAATVVVARPAATVVVARPAAVHASGPTGIEVLVLRRSAGSPFAPGFVVFPGGTVEASDAVLAERWFGTRAEAARACALRELAEEAGLVMTGRSLVEGPGRRPGDAGLLPPQGGELPEIGRWIAPEFLPVRFDARFYAASASRGLEPVPDGVEIVDAWWAAPAALLEAERDGAVALAWPTARTLEALAECAKVHDALRLHVAQVPPPAGRKRP
jgi:8-oxo-dGTP pyrophosphatase MutT (NUDIX family)